MEGDALVGRCGLYCGICSDYLVTKVCHGCGCDCSSCAAHAHHERCQIYRCAESRGYATCADCEDLPCTRLIQFACDPKWRTHLPVIENLRRIRKIGLESWLTEQAAYWENDERHRRRWIALHRQCGANLDYE
jgi:hypothetical protein